jgi:hypothetical protein
VLCTAGRCCFEEDIPRLFNSTDPADRLNKMVASDPGLGGLDPEDRHRGHTGQTLKQKWGLLKTSLTYAHNDWNVSGQNDPGNFRNFSEPTASRKITHSSDVVTYCLWLLHMQRSLTAALRQQPADVDMEFSTDKPTASSSRGR